MKRVLLSLFAGVLLLSGCDVNWPAEENALPCWAMDVMCPGSTPETSRSDVEGTLQAVKFTRQSEEGAVPSVWKSSDGTVVISLGDDFQDATANYIQLDFPEGTLRCAIGATAEGIAPLERLRQLNKAGFEAAKSGTITVDDAEVATGCEEV